MKIGKLTIRSPVAWQKSGVTINNQSVMQFLKDEGCPVGYVRLVDCPEIQTPVNRIADLVSSMTLHLMENTELGDVRVKNELSRMVDVTPNELCNHKEFYYSIVANMLLYGDGNAIVYPKHSKGLLVDMIPFDMSQASIIQTPDQTSYYVMYKGKTYRPEEILHFRANPDESKPWIGKGYRVLLKDVANNLTQAQRTKKNFMENPKPTIAIAVDAMTEDFASADGRNKIAEKYISETEDGKPWVIPAELINIKEIRPLSLNDIALNESVTIDKQTAAAVFGVPPYFVGAGQYNKDEYNAFVNTVVHPIAKAIQQEMSRKLLFKEEWYFKFNHRSLLAYDLTELVASGGELVDRMAMDRNEYRDSLGYSPEERYSDLLGLENYLPAELLGSQKKLNGVAINVGEDIQMSDGITGDTPNQTINAQQMTAFNNIIEKVIDGTYTKDAAMKWIALALPTVSPEDAKLLIEGVNPQAGGETT